MVFSPSQIEIQLGRNRRALIMRISKVVPLWAIPVLALLLWYLQSSVFHYFRMVHNFPHFRGFEIVKLFTFSSGMLLLISPLSLVIRERFQIYFQYFVLCLVWVLVSERYFSHLPLAVRLLVDCSLPVYSILAWASLRLSNLNRFKRWHIALAYALFFWSYFSILTSYLVSYDPSRILFYFRFKHVLFWVMVTYNIFNRKTSSRAALTVLQPTNALFGILWPIGTYWYFKAQAVKVRIWWRGFLNLSVSILFTLLLVALHRLFGSLENLPLLEAMRNYLFAIIALMIFANSFVGLIRMYGFRVKDATNMVFLSRTPAEFWKRALVYQYEFLFRFVFFPMKRRFRHLSVAMALSFFGFFMNKSELFSFLAVWIAGVSNELSQQFRTHVVLILAYWAFYQLLLLTWRKYFIDLRVHRSIAANWISIACTHVSFIAIFYLARLAKPFIATYLGSDGG